MTHLGLVVSIAACRMLCEILPMLFGGLTKEGGNGESEGSGQSFGITFSAKVSLPFQRREYARLILHSRSLVGT